MTKYKRIRFPVTRFDNLDEQYKTMVAIADSYRRMRSRFEGWNCPGCGAPIRVDFGASDSLGMGIGFFCSKACFPGYGFFVNPFTHSPTRNRAAILRQAKWGVAKYAKAPK